VTRNVSENDQIVPNNQPILSHMYVLEKISSRLIYFRKIIADNTITVLKNGINFDTFG
jgi:hypothetical protein